VLAEQIMSLYPNHNPTPSKKVMTLSRPQVAMSVTFLLPRNALKD